jgi:hypothetical protein
LPVSNDVDLEPQAAAKIRSASMESSVIVRFIIVIPHS